MDVRKFAKGHRVSVNAGSEIEGGPERIDLGKITQVHACGRWLTVRMDTGHTLNVPVWAASYHVDGVDA